MKPSMHEKLVLVCVTAAVSVVISLCTGIVSGITQGGTVDAVTTNEIAHLKAADQKLLVAIQASVDQLTQTGKILAGVVQAQVDLTSNLARVDQELRELRKTTTR